MKPLQNNPYAAHREVSLLLPWYVNKTLQGAELEWVENHLKVCLTCRRELVALQNQATAVRQEGANDTAAQASFSRLKKRLYNHQSPGRMPALTGPSIPDQRKEPGKLWRLPRPELALAAVLLLSLLMMRFIDIGTFEDNQYRTLSNAEHPSMGKNTLRVIFSNDTQQAQINGILASIQGRIVDGPAEQGVYTIAVDSELAVEQVLARVASLQKNAHVIFAEPAYALLSPVHDNKAENK